MSKHMMRNLRDSEAYAGSLCVRASNLRSHTLVAEGLIHYDEKFKGL